MVVTHDHHFDSDGVRRVAAEDATVVVYEGVDAERIPRRGRTVESSESLPHEVVRVGYVEELEVAGVHIEPIPAYNLADGPWGDARNGEALHPEGFGCGYLLTVDDRRC